MTAIGSIDQRPQLTFRMGRAEDVRPMLEAFGEDFFHEVGLDEYSTFDIDCAEAKVKGHIASGDNPYILADLDDKIVGVGSYSLSHVWTREPIAIMWMTYVSPPHRHGDVGRLLIDRMLDLAKHDGACAFFATVPTLGEGGQALCSLFRYYGFLPMPGFQRRI